MTYANFFKNIAILALPLIVVASICLYFVHYQFTESTQPIYSQKQPKSYNSSLSPSFIGFFTDVHINSLIPSTEEVTHKSIQVLQNLNIKNLIIGGDLVDDWATNTSIKFGHQYEPDFQAYKRIFSDKFDNIVEVAGNHDEFGVGSYNSDIHNFRKYSILV